MSAFESEGRTADGSALGHNLEHFGGIWQTGDGFAAYVAELDRQSDPAVAPPPGWVNSSSFWLVDALRVRVS
jgi:predicted acetyltransferase